MLVRTFVVAAIAAISLTAIAEENGRTWPQYLGHDRNAVAKVVAGDWEKSPPTERWRLSIGPGFGGAAIADDVVYLLDRIEGEADVFRAISLTDGKEIWRHRYDAPGRLSHHGSRAVPTLADGKAWTLGGFGQLTCYDLQKRAPAWQLNLDDVFSTASLKWGYAQSPLLVDGLIVVAPPHPDSPRLAAFHADTGKLAWQSGKDGGDFYVSPALRTIAGVAGILVLTNEKLSFHEPKTGAELWNYTGWSCRWPIPAPTVLRDEKHVMVTGGYGAGSVMLACTRVGLKWEIQETFRLKEGCQIHPFVEFNGHLYGNINENDTLKRRGREKGGLACVDPVAGKVLWRTGEDPNFGRGAVLLAKDTLLVMDGDVGSVTAVNPSPKQFVPRATIKAFPHSGGDHKIWAPIAIVDGSIVIRDQNELKAFSIP